MFTVLEERMRREASGHTRKEFLCRCKCGDTKWRSAQHVKTGRSTQCRSCSVKKHGLSDVFEYKVWYAMLHRCNNKSNANYHRYGGRGIQVSSSWHNYENFIADMGACPTGLTLERVDNDKGYSKENCVWATRATQSANRSSTVLITAFGKTQHAAAWARETGIRHDTLSLRLKRGWSAEKALTTKVKNG